MRVLGNIKHPKYKITIFGLDSKYMIKVEDGLVHFSFKIPKERIEIEDIHKAETFFMQPDISKKLAEIEAIASEFSKQFGIKPETNHSEFPDIL